MKESIKIIIAYILISLIWSSTWLVIKAGLESLTPMFSVGVRFLVASVLILLLVKYRGIKIQTDKLAMKLYILMGFFSFGIPFGLVYWAEQFVPSGLTAVLFAVYPFFILLFSYFALRGESIGYYKVLGIFLGFSGIVIIFSDSFGSDITSYLIGMFAVVISSGMQAAIAVLIKKRGHHLNPLSMNLFPMMIAGIFLLIFSFITEDINELKFDVKAILSVLYLAVFGSVIAFTTYYWLLKRMNVVILSLVAFITPVLALFLGWIVYDEQLSARHFWGSLLVLTGILWANLGNTTWLKNKRKLQTKT